MLSPSDIGLPPKFSNWRPGQDLIITNMCHFSSRYHVPVVPTGGGKSASYISTALLSKGRTLILTSTRGLQDQLLSDFGKLVTLVKGKGAYKCKASGFVWTCQTGSCHWGYDCPHKGGGCEYHDALRQARKSRIVVSNYSFWMANKPDVIGNFDLLVMDEAHDAAEHLLGVLSMEIRREEVYGVMNWPDPKTVVSRLYDWVKVLKGVVDDLVKKGKGGTRGKFRYLALQQKLGLLEQIWMDNWVVEHRGSSICWDAIWPAPLAQGYLFRGIPKVIMTSAFVTKADLTMLGIKPEEMDYIDYPSIFPVANRPVYYIPTVRMDRRITTMGMNAWANRIDQIAGSRMGEKGIIHTVSYDRSKRICNFSHYKDFMIGHDGKTAGGAVARFKNDTPPSILVSPSMVTGYDFPYDEARWQIIGKVSFPDSRPLVMKARQRINADYGCYLALKQLVQATGRICRAVDDYGDTFVIDDHFSWVLNKYHHLLPKWWVESVRTTNIIPGAR